MKVSQRCVWVPIAILGAAVVLLGSPYLPSPTHAETARAEAADSSLVTDFRLGSHTGGAVQFMDVVKGNKVTVLNFFATWCPPCNAETPDFVDFYKAYSTKGVEVVAVDIQEGRAKVGQFIDKYKLTYPVLLDVKGKVAEAYGVYSIPTTLVVDRKGRILKSFMGMTTRAKLVAAVRRALK